MNRINYKSFIEDNFQIINKEGKIVPFTFNDVQNYYYELLSEEYPTFQNIRENILKFRQPGFSALIDGLFTSDFILGEEGKVSLTFSDIYSHKDIETRTLYDRVSFYLDSYLNKYGKSRKSFLEEDTTTHMKGKRKSEINVRTANARVSGRGGTKQNMHFSEPSFYPNTEVLNANDLVLGAEQQVGDGVGKIFRESTGNMIGDFFNEEYEFGKQPQAKFKSRFLGWWLHKEYSLSAPDSWQPDDRYKKLMEEQKVHRDQCYWHYMKISSAKPQDRNRIIREYPTDDIEAFLQQGSLYFDVDALKYYKDIWLRKPMLENFQYV